MQDIDGQRIFSASDLTGFLACRHLTQLELRAAAGEISRPHRHDPLLELLTRRGLEHETRQVEHLSNQGRDVLEIPRPASTLEGLSEAADATADAMRRGVEVIYQATLFDGTWRGHPDFLIREETSPEGSIGYEVLDAKLARRPKATAILQLSIYSDLVAQLQGSAPQAMHLILGTDETETFRVNNFAAYYRRIKQLFEEAVEGEDTYPEPVEHCSICRWAVECSSRRRDDDYLSLVAGMRRDQIRQLNSAEINTVEDLAVRSPTEAVKGIAPPTMLRLQDQAAMQVQKRTTHRPEYKILPLSGSGHGLEALPSPSVGDLFFDVEADPYAEPEGLEFLFGVGDHLSGEPSYGTWWAHDRAEERSAFEAFIDCAIQRHEAFPDMHIFHYAPYEPSALKRLMGRHGTCEDELDRLLRAGVFIDLLQVVRQSLRISEESYSIKRVEIFYGFKRADAITESSTALIEYERFLETKDESILDALETYNEADCLSLRHLRDWLETLRLEAEKTFEQTLSRPELSDGGASEALSEALEKTAALRAQLSNGVPEAIADRSDDEQARWLLGQLLEWHRREAKSEWWAYFDRLKKTPEELIDDSDCLGGLTYESPVGEEGRSYIHRLSFPQQEHKIGLGRNFLDVETERGVGNIVELSDNERYLLIKKEKNREDHPEGIMPPPPVSTIVLRQAIERVAESIIEHGTSPNGPRGAIADLLTRRPPRVRDHPESTQLQGHDEDVLAAATRIALSLDNSYLPIQGPPGTGKTFTGAHIILSLVRNGRRVGIVATSHKVITNLLDKVFELASPGEAKALQRCSAGEGSISDGVTIAKTNAVFDAARAKDEFDIVAGTAWLFSRPELENTLNTLIIEEAGQFSLANAAAVCAAAQNLVLLGDPQQLSQPSHGIHPPGAGVSVLEHVLGEDLTLPSDRGLFLSRTYRMHPDVCYFISDAFYEGRLHSVPECSEQRVLTNATDPGTGIILLPVAHSGNRIASTEEANVIRRTLSGYLEKSWVDAQGAERSITLDDVVVVAPYNAQVGLLSRVLPLGARVGTVDKFQGQEAAVTIYSMATSSPEDIPRTFEFLYSRNRLNVAVSRARAIGIVVCCPELLRARCSTPRQMQLANALCRFAEIATS
jgi:predicted RecB family nuclease